MWDDGHILALGVLDSQYSASSRGLNDAGEIVGNATVSDGNDSSNTAFIWRNHVMHDLQDLLIYDAKQDWDLSSSIDVNASSQILCNAYSRLQALRAPVRLDPVDEGLTVWSFSPSLADAVNTLEVIHATPNGRVVFVAGTERDDPVNLPQCPGASIELLHPRMIGSAIADGNGRATLSRFLPANQAAKRYVIQAIDWSTCETSPPGFIQIQP
jgi:probable HAF family extracellular repeat protein